MANYPGLNIEEGIARVRKPERYTLLLNSFLNNYSDIATQVDTLLASGDWRETQAVLHMIKGVSGNVSANAMYHTTEALESAVKAQDIAKITPLQAQWGQDVKVALHSIAQYIADHPAQ